MNNTDWLDSALQDEPPPPVSSPKSGYKTEVGTKVGTAESLIQQGFQGFVPTVPTVPTFFNDPGEMQKHTPKPPQAEEKPTARDHHQPVQLTPVTGKLLSMVHRICILEQWATYDKQEWLAILSGQIARQEATADELVLCLQAHLERHHTPQAEQPKPGTVSTPESDCMSCRHWQGTRPYSQGRLDLFKQVGIAPTPQSRMVPVCTRRHTPWRVSNIPGVGDYSLWHFIGPCHYERKAA